MLSFDIVTVGHFSIDFIKTKRDSISKPSLGGPPTFVSLAAKRLKAKVSVISNVGEDFPEEYVRLLMNEDIDLSMLRRVKGASTTSYELIYDEMGGRQLILKSRAPPITSSLIPESLSAKVVHVSPIADEVSYEVINKLRENASLLSLDPQGLLRRFGNDGRVSLGKLKDRRVLRIIDIFKASEEEIKIAMGDLKVNDAIGILHRMGVDLVIATRGGRGVTLSFNGRIYKVPAAKPRVVVDTTGAGDVFIGA
ncbi:MAG TPA: hypothetical protein ENG65_03025, partial [Candidatus Bathyarchaeota archaeon]|nr:hypothetical protein [Candidatus Bathyarchaeota archaeon]